MKAIYSMFFMMLAFGITMQAQLVTPQPSPFSEVEQTVGITEFEVEYSRPSMKERKIFGELVAYDKKWRTGANKNTMISFDTEVKFEGVEVPAGTYAIFTKPGKEMWEIYLYTDTENWGVPREWDDKKVAATFSVKPVTLPIAFESFLINFSHLRNNSAQLQLVWENTLVPINIEVPTKDLMMERIDETMAGPTANDYYRAASYYLQEGVHLDKAEKYIDLALEGGDKYWVLGTKANIQAEVGKFESAIVTGEKAITAANEAGNENYAKMTRESIAEWKSMK